MEVGCWSIQGLWLNETSWHGQCSTKETPHTIESNEGCSKQLGMCMLKGCRPLAHIYTFSGGANSNDFWASTCQLQLAQMASCKTDFLCTLMLQVKIKFVKMVSTWVDSQCPLPPERQLQEKFLGMATMTDFGSRICSTRKQYNIQATMTAYCTTKSKQYSINS